MQFIGGSKSAFSRSDLGQTGPSLEPLPEYCPDRDWDAHLLGRRPPLEGLRANRVRARAERVARLAKRREEWWRRLSVDTEKPGWPKFRLSRIAGQLVTNSGVIATASAMLLACVHEPSPIGTFNGVLPAFGTVARSLAA